MRIGIGHHAPDPDTRRSLAAARAVADALRGAAGLSGDEEAADAGSETSAGPDLLSRTVLAVEGENYQVVNVDLTLVGETAGDGAGDDRVREALAERLHVAPEKVGLKPGGTPAWADREDARAVLAVVLLDRIASMDQVHSALRAGG